MKKNTQSQIGFTLIELLVVIAVLGMLAAILVVATSSARAKARDARRAADLGQISKALEMYYSNYGTYPAHSESVNTPKKNWGDMLLDLQSEGLISVQETDDYATLSFGSLIRTAQAMVGPPADNPLKTSPQDPLYPDKYYEYMVTPNFMNYRIRTKLENPSNTLISAGLTGNFNYPGGVTPVGDTSCDKSLGYYCVGSINGF